MVSDYYAARTQNVAPLIALRSDLLHNPTLAAKMLKH